MNKTASSNEALSPCNNQCRLDVDNTFCTSCYRTVEEKKNWWRFSTEDKMVILTRIDSQKKVK